MGKIIVLYPGSFKPFHGGHLDLIHKYANNTEVEVIRILIGPGIRGGINQEISSKIVRKLTYKLPNIFIESVEWKSPVLASYKIIEQARPGKYTLAASSKELENAERIDHFVLKHSKDNKFYRDGIEVVNLSVDISPLLFKGRNDEFEGTAISSSVLREDLRKGNIENFITGYPNCEETDIKYIWKLLLNDIKNRYDHLLSN